MNKKQYWVKANKMVKKIKAINFLGGKCEMCGEKNIFKLCFHHIISEEKERNIADLKYSKWKIIEKELKKCKLFCHNCHHKLHFENDKENVYKSNKKIFLEFKGLIGCEKCGYNECKSSLDFHHNDKGEKDFIISIITTKYTSVENLTEKIEKELNKCIVLCKNCHNLEHSDSDFYEKYKDDIINRIENFREIQGKIDRIKVKKLYENGMKQIDIAKFFNASKGTISGIIKEIKQKL